MLKTRVIPCLLLQNHSLVKTVKFDNPDYVGDPINAVRIYNELEVDELIFLDISATINGCGPNENLIADIASECFMPFCYGGGIKDLETMKRLFALGVEKIAINSAAYSNPALISEAARLFGNQAIVASIDVKKKFLNGYEVYVHGGKNGVGINPVVYAKKMEELGVGEILLTSIDFDGTWKGYDLELIESVSSAVNVPIIACGGAGKLEDFSVAVKSGASAVATGSFVVYQKKGLGVLINFPSKSELESVF